MKKVIVLFSAMLFMVALAGCQRPYMVPLTEEIGTNETAFLINMEGDGQEGQAKLDSVAYYEAAKVVAKRITIAQRWQQMGRVSIDGKWIPTQKLIKVDRTPITRLWYSEGSTVGNKPGIACETLNSIGVTIGLQISGRIEEGNASKFLYYYNGKSLADVMDTDIYGAVSSITASIIGTYSETDLTLKKVDFVNTLTKQINDKYTPFGITLYSIGMYAGFIFDNPEIQKAIDSKMIAERNKAASQMQIEAARAQANIKVAEAQGEADANRIKQQSMTNNLLEWQRLQNEAAAIKIWDGKLPSYVTSGSSMPFIGIK